MISRSDGDKFHLLLADRPVPYPNERASGPTDKVSVCYWYSHVRTKFETRTAIVVLPCPRTNHPAVFRLIESVADLLANELNRFGNLSEFYEFVPSSTSKMESRQGTARPSSANGHRGIRL
jgi:hypothetical protein